MRSYTSDRLVDKKGIDKRHLKSDCTDGKVANTTRQSFLYRFTVEHSPDVEINTKPRHEICKKVNNLNKIIFMYKVMRATELILMMKRSFHSYDTLFKTIKKFRLAL